VRKCRIAFTLYFVLGLSRILRDEFAKNRITRGGLWKLSPEFRFKALGKRYDIRCIEYYTRVRVRGADKKLYRRRSYRLSRYFFSLLLRAHYLLHSSMKNNRQRRRRFSRNFHFRQVHSIPLALVLSRIIINYFIFYLLQDDVVVVLLPSRPCIYLHDIWISIMAIRINNIRIV